MPDQPVLRTGTIPSSTPSGIPLRNLIPPSRRSESDEHSPLRPDGDEHDEKRGGSPRRSSDSAGSDFSFFSDTGDLAQQLADEEDPLQIDIRGSSEGKRLGTPHAARSRIHTPHTANGTRSQKETRHVRYADQGQLEDNKLPLDKEAIEIPDPGPRKIGPVEKLLAVIMTGNRERARSSGLVGKPLLCVHTINRNMQSSHCLQVFYQCICLIRSLPLRL